jgi:Holliday junction DNA helicase RuvA
MTAKTCIILGMIAKITGTVFEKTSSSVIVDVAGIGYEVVVAPTLLDELDMNAEVTFYTAEHIKEDDYTLYGFLQSDGRAMYHQLTSVSGVGPKAAMAILSKHSVDEIQSAIIADNISLFSNVSGIGKKTAQRIILDIKGKLVAAPADKPKADDQAYQALLSLGYSSKDAHSALQDIDSKLSTNERVKQALKGTSK